MKAVYIILSFAIVFFSCKDDTKKVEMAEKTKKVEEKDPDESAKPVSDKSGLDSLIMDNGLKMHWINKGEGEGVKTGDCINIEYKVFLEDGKLIEGNYKLKKAVFPYVVGFGMQTKGWELALAQMKIGDEVEVFIPSELARGKKGVPGIIPPDANNILYLKILDKRKPTREIDGSKVYVFEENAKNELKFNKENTIEFYTVTSSESKPRYFDSKRQGKPFVMKMKDAGTVPGLKKSLNNAKRADRMYVVVPPSEAYGSKGLQGFVESNEHLLFDIFVSDVY